MVVLRRGGDAEYEREGLEEVKSYEEVKGEDQEERIRQRDWHSREQPHHERLARTRKRKAGAGRNFRVRRWDEGRLQLRQ